MSRTIARLCYAPLLLVSCNIQDPPQGTMQLLRSGNAALCVAGDVQETLRDLIRPKDQDVSSYTISFSETVLLSFDPNVSRAECRSNVRVNAPDGENVSTSNISYTVVPSSENPDDFVLSTSVFGIRSALETAVAVSAANQEANRLEQEAEQAEADRRTALRALATPRWLVGRWVDQNDGYAACRSDAANVFQKDGRVIIEGDASRWDLKGGMLIITSATGVTRWTILAADQNSFDAENANRSISKRRCSEAEVSGAVDQPPHQETNLPPVDGTAWLNSSDDPG